MINPAVATFVQEAHDLLEGLEELLLELETDPGAEQVDAVFRTLHTVKGSGAMFGFGVLARFTHHFENAFDMVRMGRLSINRRLIDLSLRARDHMKTLLEFGGDTPEAAAIADGPEATALIAELTELTGASGEADAAPAAPATDAARGGSPVRFDIWFKPDANALRNGMRPDLLIEELEGLGAATATLDLSAVPALEDLEPDLSYLGWRIVLETSRPRDAIEGVFMFADDAELDIAETAPVEEARAKAVEAVAVTAVAQPNPARETPMRRSTDTATESVRVPAARLDEMMDQLGELVIAQARLDQIAARINDPLLESVVEEVERLVTGLRDATLSIRMLPIEVVFGKFRRVVRDLSADLGKDVTLITEGGETEIDKNVIDRLSEPLVHMIRNSVDHGVESAERRAAAGKPARGAVRLSARQEGGEVLIAIEDDGAGLDTDAIRARAIERGLLAADATPSVSDLHQLIFAPGFSTAKVISSVSGRGVGMDAVRTTVDALRGSIDVASWPGRGSRVTLRLPVTLAIIDGLLVRLGEVVFVIPLSSVEECVELDAAEARRESGRSMLQIREHLVPFLDLDDVFSLEPSTEPRRRVVIVKADGAQVGLVVDDILGQNQTVIKTLSAFHRGVEGFAGATILGDGAVALIIDVATLVRAAISARGASSRDLSAA
jgi:two-component system chemotaxis sensor kinase CheA